MSITATRFATQIRTWLLIAGLTALLIAIGAAIGGGALYIVAALAVLMNVAGYWFSDRLALAASRARPLEAGEIPELDAIARDLARRADVPVPRLYLIGSGQPNAFATGRDPAHAAVAVTDGLLQQLPREEVRGVLAHDFATSRTAARLSRSSSLRSQPPCSSWGYRASVSTSPMPPVPSCSAVPALWPTRLRRWSAPHWRCR